VTGGNATVSGILQGTFVRTVNSLRSFEDVAASAGYTLAVTSAGFGTSGKVVIQSTANPVVALQVIGKNGTDGGNAELFFPVGDGLRLQRRNSGGTPIAAANLRPVSRTEGSGFEAVSGTTGYFEAGFY